MQQSAPRLRRLENSHLWKYARMREDRDITGQVERAVDRHLAFFRTVPLDKETHRYAPGKWSVREVAGHLCDFHHIFTYRILCLSRGEPKVLLGHDENLFAAAAPYGNLPMARIAELYGAMAGATVRLLKTLSPEDWQREGGSNGTAVRALDIAKALIGHEAHHLGVLRDRYGLP